MGVAELGLGVADFGRRGGQSLESYSALGE